MTRTVKHLSNGQLYTEWNGFVWLRQRGQTLSPKQQVRMDEIEAEAATRPAEAE